MHTCTQYPANTQRRYKVAATSRRCSDVVRTLWLRCVFAGYCRCDVYVHVICVPCSSLIYSENTVKEVQFYFIRSICVAKLVQCIYVYIIKLADVRVIWHKNRDFIMYIRKHKIKKQNKKTPQKTNKQTNKKKQKKQQQQQQQQQQTAFTVNCIYYPNCSVASCTRWDCVTH